MSSRVVKDPLLITLAALLAIILTYLKPRPCELLQLVDWKTIANLLVILLAVKGLELSGFLSYIATRVILKCKNLRNLALVYTLTVFALAPAVTNDISLLVLIPLLSAIACILERDLGDLAIFAAIAANAGSSLTPIGNPQNLIILHRYHISFFKFIEIMSIPVIMMFLVLMTFVLLTYWNKREIFQVDKLGTLTFNRKLAVASALLLIFIIFLLATPLRHVEWLSYIAVPLSIILFLIIDRKVIYRADWNLLITIFLMFLDFGMLSRIDILRNVMTTLLKGTMCIYVTSVFLSQIISNVPATVLLMHFTSQYVPLLYGVNIGGNGTLIASLANLIAYRTYLGPRSSGFLRRFHKVSLAYLTVTSIIAASLLYVHLFA